VPEFGQLERVVDAAYPERFAKKCTGLHAEFSSAYVFSVLEACIARCGSAHEFDHLSSGQSTR